MTTINNLNNLWRQILKISHHFSLQQLHCIINHLTVRLFVLRVHKYELVALIKWAALEQLLPQFLVILCRRNRFIIFQLIIINRYYQRFKRYFLLRVLQFIQ